VILVALVLRRLLHRAGREIVEEHWPGSAGSFATLMRFAGSGDGSTQAI
jgi:hypothetical protein